MSLSGEAVLYASSPSDKIAQETARRERRRRKVVKELFETERTYLHHLAVVNKFFDFPLRFACLVPDNVHNKLFSNLEQIREVNATLLEQMEQTTVGQAFSQLGPYLKLYSWYANNHQQALSTLQEWQTKSSDFAQFIAKQEDRPEVNGLKLPALLITPVQRIPRYKLLLEELLNSTPVEHHDYIKLREAADQCAEIAAHINEHIRQNENFIKMLAIQRSFDSSAPKLLVPGRTFVKEGSLKKVSRKGGKSFDRIFFLFSDILLYGKPKMGGNGQSYTCSCVLPLRHVKVEPVFITNIDKCEAGGVFKISCKEESLVLYSEDPSNAKSWSSEIEKARSKLCNDRQTLRKPSSQKVPLRGRSLRKARQLQKKNEIKVIGTSQYTPRRPLSQVSNLSQGSENSQGVSSGSNRDSLADWRASQDYTDTWRPEEMDSGQGDMDHKMGLGDVEGVDMDENDLPLNEPEHMAPLSGLRYKTPVETRSSGHFSDASDLALGSLSYSQSLRSDSSHGSLGQSSQGQYSYNSQGQESYSQSSQEVDLSEQRQSLKEYRFSLRRGRSVERLDLKQRSRSRSTSERSQEVNPEEPPEKPPRVGRSGERAPRHFVKQRTRKSLSTGSLMDPDLLLNSRPPMGQKRSATLKTSTSGTSGNSAYFPPGSPAHKLQLGKGINTRIRSCFDRIKKAKRDITSCSPFRGAGSSSQHAKPGQRPL